MSTERIDIVITERGSRIVRRDLEKLGSSAKRAQGGVQLLRSTLAALGGAAAIRGLVNLSDTFTNVQNRLKIVTHSTAELASVTEDLFDIANRTRSSFLATATIYSRTALAVKELGIAQTETLAFMIQIAQ